MALKGERIAFCCNSRQNMATRNAGSKRIVEVGILGKEGDDPRFMSASQSC